MSETNIEDSGITHDVYLAHRNSVLGDRNEVGTRKAYSYVPVQDPPGTQIEFIRRYADTKIKEKDAERMKCSVIPELSHLCRVISDRENDRSQSKIYAAFVVAGVNIRYSDMKNENQDVIYDIGEHIHCCVSSYDRELMEFTSHNDVLFEGARSDTVRFESSIAGRTRKESAKCSIRLADMNLYNALAGVERFSTDDPDYIPPNGGWIVDDCLSVFARAKRKLKFRDMGLQCIINHKDEMMG